MIEGDIIKWKNWLNFLGLHTRYRLTRLQGRYSSVEAEVHQPHTIHSLSEREGDPLVAFSLPIWPQVALCQHCLWKCSVSEL